MAFSHTQLIEFIDGFNFFLISSSRHVNIDRSTPN